MVKNKLSTLLFVHFLILLASINTKVRIAVVGIFGTKTESEMLSLELFQLALMPPPHHTNYLMHPNNFPKVIFNIFSFFENTLLSLKICHDYNKISE
jgi:hypothetical protein